MPPCSRLWSVASNGTCLSYTPAFTGAAGAGQCAPEVGGSGPVYVPGAPGWRWVLPWSASWTPRAGSSDVTATGVATGGAETIGPVVRTPACRRPKIATITTTTMPRPMSMLRPPPPEPPEGWPPRFSRWRRRSSRSRRSRRVVTVIHRVYGYLDSRDERAGAIRTVSDGLAAHRQRPHHALQL